MITLLYLFYLQPKFVPKKKKLTMKRSAVEAFSASNKSEETDLILGTSAAFNEAIQFYMEVKDRMAPESEQQEDEIEVFDTQKLVSEESLLSE